MPEARREGGARVDADAVRRFLDLSIDLLGILDLDTTILETSESWTRAFGWSRDQLLGTPLLSYFHPDDLSRIEDELARLLEGGDAVAVVVRVRCADGTYRWVQGNARADLVAGRIYVTAADITDRKALEDGLLHQVRLEERVAAMTARLMAAPDDEVDEVLTDSLGELADAVGADRAHFLRGRRGAVIDVHEWLHPEHGQRTNIPEPSSVVQRWWSDVLLSGRRLSLEDVAVLEAESVEVVENLNADGVRSILLVPLPVHDGYGGFVALVAIRQHVRFDDTFEALIRLAGEGFLAALVRRDHAAALVDARRELEERNTELERSNGELERFAYSAAHDLKAPLARIEMALAAVPSGSGEGADLLGVARRGAARLRQLIEDLLTYASVGAVTAEVEEVDLDDLLGQVLVDLDGAVAAAGATVQTEPLGSVWGHRALLGQLLQNLVGNAVKFARAEVPGVIKVTATRDPDGVTLRVIDNGIGIAPAHRQEVFGVFTRLNSEERFAGSGIGLATCAKVVANHGGRMWVEDGVEGGTTIVVRLPTGSG